MRARVCYVLGGALDPALEAKKQAGEQPLAEFNVFVRRNDATLLSTADVAGASGPVAGSFLSRVRLARHVRRRRHEFDVLVASGEDVGIPLALATLGMRDPPPIWMALHGSLLQGWKFRAVAPLLRRAGHVGFLCLSASLQRRLIDEYGFAPERCRNAGYGVDIDFFAAAQGATSSLIVSAGSAHRDYATLSEAASTLDVAVRIAADSLWRPQGATDEERFDPAPNVRLKSAGDYLGLRALYASASFVVVPLFEARHACGYAVIAEAMAMGKAVIATRTGAPSDLIVPGETGLYVEPGDVTGLRDAMRSLLMDRDLAHRMGQAGAARMRDRFSLPAYCETMEAICLSRPGGREPLVSGGMVPAE